MTTRARAMQPLRERDLVAERQRDRVAAFAHELNLAISRSISSRSPSFGVGYDVVRGEHDIERHVRAQPRRRRPPQPPSARRGRRPRRSSASSSRREARFARLPETWTTSAPYASERCVARGACAVAGAVQKYATDCRTNVFDGPWSQRRRRRPRLPVGRCHERRRATPSHAERALSSAMVTTTRSASSRRYAFR